jgi:hypothetical protein
MQNQFTGSFFNKSLVERQRENAQDLILKEQLQRSLNQQLKATNVWRNDKKVYKLVGSGNQTSRFGILSSFRASPTNSNRFEKHFDQNQSSSFGLQ